MSHFDHIRSIIHDNDEAVPKADFRAARVSKSMEMSKSRSVNRAQEEPPG